MWWSWWTRTYLCVACKTFYGDLNIFIYLSMYAWLLCLYLHECLWNAMYLWLYLVINVVGVIFCVFLLYHYILSIDCTYSFRHLTFCKIVQKSSTYFLVWILCSFNPCISLGELLVQIWKAKLYYAYLFKNSKCCHESLKRGRLKVHLGPHVCFRQLMAVN
jgi:hypothetical protein